MGHSWSRAVQTTSAWVSQGSSRSDYNIRCDESRVFWSNWRISWDHQGWTSKWHSQASDRNENRQIVITYNFIRTRPAKSQSELPTTLCWDIGKIELPSRWSFPITDFWSNSSSWRLCQTSWGGYSRRLDGRRRYWGEISTDDSCWILKEKNWSLTEGKCSKVEHGRTQIKAWRCWIHSLPSNYIGREVTKRTWSSKPITRTSQRIVTQSYIVWWTSLRRVESQERLISRKTESNLARKWNNRCSVTQSWRFKEECSLK